MNATGDTQMSILVTGATGTVGRQLVAQLAAAGHPVRALTRNPARAQFSAGVEVVQGDLTHPETLATALQGVTGLHLINFGGDNYAALETGPQIMSLAKAAGVQRVTVLLGGELGALEVAVQASGLDWTFLQPVEFMSGLFDHGEAIQSGGEVRMGFLNRRSAMVHEADIAAVAAVALTEPGHGGKTYTLTGPEVLTPHDIFRILGEAVGREISLVELSEEEARAEWAAQGFPPDTIEFFVWVFGNTPEIGYTVVPTVEEVTGRVARSLAVWAAENRNHFVKQN
jgi:uncharacterized protein YbjT (DUF2867 family)